MWIFSVHSRSLGTQKTSQFGREMMLPRQNVLPNLCASPTVSATGDAVDGYTEHQKAIREKGKTGGLGGRSRDTHLRCL